MKLINMRCPNCNAYLQIKEGIHQYKCEHCASTFLVDEEVKKTRIDNAENTGYQFEKGRMKAQSEAGIIDVPPEKKKITIWRVLLWVVFLPIMVLYVIWTNKKLSQKMKIILSVIVVLFTVLFASKNKIEKAYATMTMKKENVIPAKEVYFAEWLDDCFEMIEKDVHVKLSKDHTEATLTIPLRCKKNPLKYAEEEFKKHDENYEDYELTNQHFELNNVFLHEGSYNAEGMRNAKKIKEILNMEEGEHELEIIVPLEENKVSAFMNQTQLYLQMRLHYENKDKDYIAIPWYKSEHQEPTPTPEETIEATVETTIESTPVPTEVSTLEPTMETKEVVVGVTPAFKEQMDSYEAFMDSYIEFMESYDGSNMNMMLKYTELLGKYADWAKKVDDMDTSTMTPADEAYYFEVMLRVEQKLLKASINF